MFRRTALVLFLAAGLAVAVTPAIAGRGGNGANGNGARYQGTLTASPNVLHAGDYFTVSGCGYDPSLGNVIVGFTGGSWGSPLDSNGCFTVGPIAALSGDTLPPGTYPVVAYQYVHNKWTETGETTVTVVL
jgi:hypothetical protein